MAAVSNLAFRIVLRGDQVWIDEVATSAAERSVVECLPDVNPANGRSILVPAEILAAAALEAENHKADRGSGPVQMPAGTGGVTGGVVVPPGGTGSGRGGGGRGVPSGGTARGGDIGKGLPGGGRSGSGGGSTAPGSTGSASQAQRGSAGGGGVAGGPPAAGGRQKEEDKEHGRKFVKGARGSVPVSG